MEIIGPFWFENADEETVTVTKENYIVALNKFWRAHTANITMECFDHRFSNLLISRPREPEWSPHSPDLNPPDFYLWGFLKDNVYENTL